MIDDALLPFAEGQLLGGKYRVDRVLGEGAFGVVVAARHVELDEDVAIKVLRPKKAADPAVVERLLREARAVVRLKGEHVVRVLDVGKLDSGAPYIVMERLVGNDLGWVLAERAKLPVEEAVGYVLQACEAVAEAHALGMVHRDLKLSNLFLTTRPDGTSLVKVLDFGVAKWTVGDAEGKRLTGGDTGMGSPLYMSPEQLQDARGADMRADIWSLGVILHELIAGKPPFDSESTTGVIAAVLTAAPPALRSLEPATPAELEQIVLRCLEKDRDKRVASVAELARGLEPFASEEDRACVRRIGRLSQAASTRIGFASVPDASEAAASVPALSAPLSAPHAAAVAPGASTDDSLRAARLPSRASKWLYAAGAGAVAVVIGISIALTSRTPPEDARGLPASTASIASGAAPASPASTLHTAEPTSSATAGEPAAAEGTATAPTASAAPSPRPSSRPVTSAGRPSAVAAASSSPAPKPSAPSSGKHHDLRSLIDGRR